MNTYKACSIIFLIISTKLSFGQDVNSINGEFVKVSKIIECPVPPFPKNVIELSNSQMCFRAELPSRQEMDQQFMELYDKINRTPKCWQLDSVDFKLIVKFIMTSELLNIDLDYTKPKSKDGVAVVTVGGCSVSYVIETTTRRLDLLVSGSENFELPLTLGKFDELFQKIEEKYNGKKEE